MYIHIYSNIFSDSFLGGSKGSTMAMDMNIEEVMVSFIQPVVAW